MKKEWHEKVFEGGKIDSLHTAILFSGGGNYSVDLLSQRTQMLQLIKSKLDYMKYDLKRLQQEIILGYKPIK